MRQVHEGNDSCPKNENHIRQPDNHQPKSTKKAKIIVRNLPFKNLSEKVLEDLFSEFGEIEEIKLLRKPDGKFVGCGFVQFQKVSSAAKAIKYVNQREVNGRKIVLDWALPKDSYLDKIKKFQEQHLLNKQKGNENYDEEDTKKENIEISIDKKPDTWASESESENDNESCNENENVKYEPNSDNESVDDSYNLNPRKKKLSDKKQIQDNQKNLNDVKKFDKPSDAEDGKTVFIRNIPFSATNDDLKQCVENYGPVEYALICVDKLTEHSKGTAFVKFKSEDSASQCVKDSDKIYIDESPLNVMYALTKEHLENKKSNKKVVRDSRNLYLVREGVILAGSKAAAGVSISDMNKRLQLEQWKSQILKNLNMFVSRTRLVVHNLPPHYDDKNLRQLFLKHGNPKAIIKEAKVMWEKNKVNAEGKRISKEVGFVSFANHEDALLALRNINNNPKIFKANKRPIVAFSIENKAVINQKQKRIEKSRAKLGITIPEKLSKLNRKQRRFIKRRQKIIERRKEMKKSKETNEINTVKPDVKNSLETKSVAVEKNKKRAHSSKEESKSNKKQKLENDFNSDANENEEFKTFAGIASEPGKKIQLRSRFNLKKQASLHTLTLKKEKSKLKNQKGRKKLEPIKQPKQKKGKKKTLMEDAKLSKILKEHREKIEQASTLKKWYET